MTMLKVGRLRQVGWLCVVEILRCFCLFWLLPSVYGKADNVDQLITQLRDGSPKVREKAADALERLKDPRAVDPLIAALKDDDTPVRQIASMALGILKDRRAVEPLITAMGDTDPLVRSHSAYALGEIKDPRAVGPLIAALNDTEDWSHYPIFRGDMGYSDMGVRRSAARALGNIGSPAIEPLIAALKDPNHDVRNLATMALGTTETRDPRAISALLEAFRIRNTTVITGAGAYIFFIKRGESGSEDALIQALNVSGNWEMAKAFLNCGNPKLEDAGRRWWKEQHLRKEKPDEGAARWGSMREAAPR